MLCNPLPDIGCFDMCAVRGPEVLDHGWIAQ